MGFPCVGAPNQWGYISSEVGAVNLLGVPSYGAECQGILVQWWFPCSYVWPVRELVKGALTKLGLKFKNPGFIWDRIIHPA